MGNKKKNLARFGVASKGIVYFLIGGLTVMAAFGLGGQKANSKNVLDFVAQQSYGKILLIVLAAGLIGYVFWRWYQALADPKNNGTDTKGLIKRISYFISGIFYALLAYTAIKIAIDAGGSGSGNSFISQVFNSSYATTIAVVVGILLVGKAIYEFYQAYSGKFKEEVDQADLDNKAKKIVLKAGKVGFTARGIVVGIMAYLMFRAAANSNAEKMGKTDAFSFLENEFGSIVMGIIAAGLLAYGFFMIVKAKYSSLNVD